VVVLDGQGADEILGGYNKFVAAVAWQTAIAHPTHVLGPLRGFVRQVGTPRNLLTAGYPYLGRLGRSPHPERLVRPDLSGGERTPRVRVSSLELRVEDIRRWSLPNLLAYADRNAMAHSVETRLPYLDATVATLALAMPDDVLLRDGWTKWPLRVLLAARGGELPAWTAGKRWFGIPQDPWLRGSLRPHVQQWLETPHHLWQSLTDERQLRRFQATWQTRRPSHPYDDHVFRMVALDRFLRVWFPT
jgi:asparagine synthase (glutamine-hydrolysing)